VQLRPSLLVAHHNGEISTRRAARPEVQLFAQQRCNLEPAGLHQPPTDLGRASCFTNERARSNCLSGRIRAPARRQSS
jgi:hypothetical protein